MRRAWPWEEEDPRLRLQMGRGGLVHRKKSGKRQENIFSPPPRGFPAFFDRFCVDFSRERLSEGFFKKKEV